MSIHLLINYTISLYYEHRQQMLRSHLNYLLNMFHHSRKLKVIDEAVARSQQQLKKAVKIAKIYIDSDVNDGSWVTIWFKLRRILLLELFEIAKYYRLGQRYLIDFICIYHYIGQLDLNRMRQFMLTRAEVVESDKQATFEVVNMKHPLIEDCQPYTLQFDQALFITGTNGSGKSAFLKTIGINLMFARVFGVAFAETFRAPDIAISTYLDIKDNLQEQDSLFMTEVKIIKQILQDTETLALIDEPFRGTNARESEGLVYALLQQFHHQKRYYIMSTHHHQLAYHEDKQRRYYFIDQQGNCDYRLHPGINPHTNAIDLVGRIIGQDDFYETAKNYVQKNV